MAVGTIHCKESKYPKKERKLSSLIDYFFIGSAKMVKVN